jgi:hypothetical protein
MEIFIVLLLLIPIVALSLVLATTLYSRHKALIFKKELASIRAILEELEEMNKQEDI